MSTSDPDSLRPHQGSYQAVSACRSGFIKAITSIVNEEVEKRKHLKSIKVSHLHHCRCRPTGSQETAAEMELRLKKELDLVDALGDMVSRSQYDCHHWILNSASASRADRPQ